MKCDNCSKDAIYLYDPRPLAASAYCNSHLPSFLRHAAKVGALQTLPAFEDQKAAALARLAVSQPAEAEPEPAEAVEEPDQTDSSVPPETEPKRKRRAPRKKTAPVEDAAPVEE